MDTQEKLNQLFEYHAQKTILDMDKQTLIDAVYTPEIKKAVSDIEYEFKEKSSAVDDNISKLTEEIKTDVLTAGQSVKGDNMMAVWSKGRISWDTKALDGVIAVHPELAKFRKEGDPSVSIRKI